MARKAIGHRSKQPRTVNQILADEKVAAAAAAKKKKDAEAKSSAIPKPAADKPKESK